MKGGSRNWGAVRNFPPVRFILKIEIDRRCGIPAAQFLAAQSVAFEGAARMLHLPNYHLILNASL